MNHQREPIAIIGMSCRFPGGCRTPEDFWKILVNGSDVITEITPDRWSTDYYFHPDRKAPGKTYTISAGQVDDIFHFDPEFFGLSPREAIQMDPQQRILLEMTWEALEDGGIPPENIAGSDCSVFIGISGTDYANNRFDDPAAADGYFMTGNTLSIAANRISYLFDLRGPSMAIDTACSSSLVALHQACNSLWLGESRTSITGSVHLLLSPFPFIGFSKASMLSESGKCRAFDAAANGYVRSEGGAVLFLKPLAQARADGDPIHAVIKATGVNSDGSKSALTVPNGEAQKQLLNSLYRGIKIDAGDIDYIEAHGTGTPVGDPVEARAIGEAFGCRRDAMDPVLIGSVKSNIGHLEPASGIAGLLKVVLGLKHRAIPPSIHYSTPNPNIDFKTLNVKVVDELISLENRDKKLVMGVNSFGFGGSNAHVILEEYKPDENAEHKPDPKELPPLYLSAQDASSLKKLAGQYAGFLERNHSRENIYDVLYSTAFHRQPLNQGLIIQENSTDELIEQLQLYCDDRVAAGCVTGERIPNGNHTVFIYSGNGAQWIGMGQSLLGNAVFSRVLGEIDKKFVPLSGWSIIEALKADRERSRLQYTEVAQPLLFSIQVGVTELLGEKGIQPVAVVGHSFGEVAAAWAAGILDLESAIRLIYYRSEAQAATRNKGKMLAAQISPADVRQLLEKLDVPLELAAVNSPKSTTLVGPGFVIERAADHMQKLGIRCRILDLDYPFHSRAMEGLEDGFFRKLPDLRLRNSEVRFYSSVTGGRISARALDKKYWWDNIRRPVQFGPAIEALIDDHYGLFVEIGPHPVLQSYVRECLYHKQAGGQVVTTLRRNNTDEEDCIKKSVFSICLARGRAPKAYFPVPGKYRSLPHYPWSHKKYAISKSPEAVNKERSHVLLGYKSSSIDGLWQNQIDIDTHKIFADHAIDNSVIFPAAGFAEMALAASGLVFDRVHHEIANLEIRRPLVFDKNQTRDIQFHLNTDDYNFTIKSRPRLSDQPWRTHVLGKLINAASDHMIPHVNITEIKKRSRYVVSGAEIYETASMLGLNYGPYFRAVKDVWVNESELLSLIALPEELCDTDDGYMVHPVLMDAAFHTLFPAFAERRNRMFDVHAAPYLPVSIGDLRYHKLGGGISYCLCRVNSSGKQSINATFILLDKEGEPLVELKNCVFRRITQRYSSNHGTLCLKYQQIPKSIYIPQADSPLSETDTEALLNAVKEDLLKSNLIGRVDEFNRGVQPLYDSLASALALDSLYQLGAHLEEFTIDSLISSAEIAERHRFYLSYLVQLLARTGKIEKRDQLWKISSEPGQAELIWRRIVNQYPQYLGELFHIASRGFNLVSLLTSEAACDAVDHSVSHSLRRLNSDSLQNEIIFAVIKYLLAQWPDPGKRLRIADISGDPSIMTRNLLASLPEDWCDYTFFATNEDAVSLAGMALSEAVNVRVELLDLAGHPESALEQGAYDIVIITEHLHNIQNLAELLANVAYLAAPGGMVFAMDKRPDALQDVVNGIDPDWWSGTKLPHNPVSRLLEPGQWLNKFHWHGFEGATLLSEEVAGNTRDVLLMARQPKGREKADTGLKPCFRPNVILISDHEGYSYHQAEAFADLVASAGGLLLWGVNGLTGKPARDGQLPLDLSTGEGLEALDHFLTAKDISDRNIIYLASLQTSNESIGSDIVETQQRHCMGVTHLAKHLQHMCGEDVPRMWFVTNHAFIDGHSLADGNITPQPGQAVLWGFIRVLRNEYPGYDCRLLDIQCRAGRRRIADQLLENILYPDNEDEVVLTDAGRKALRLDNIPNLSKGKAVIQTSGADSVEAYQLMIRHPGNLDELAWVSVPGRLPGDDEVEIKVVAAGLNFRDIMYASGLLPDEMLDEGFAGAALGLECSGIVTAAGKDVTQFKIGDPVLAFAPACFSSHVIAPANTVITKPEKLSFEAAATVPTAFFTVYYSLSYLANLKAGEKVLIHGAAGGVGLAAIQYAKYCKAKIFATAGSDEKRKFLELLGADFVLNSRSLDFSDEIMMLTGGEGIDVVLNSLAGEAIDKSLSVLRPGGRFLELGKRDYFENTRIGLRPFRHNIAYFGVDADQLIKQQPDLSKSLFDKVMQLFIQNVFNPLPHSVFTADTVVDAFRLMQQSHHVGKVVVSFRKRPGQIKVMDPGVDLEFKKDASYLISGGVSGFGLATAKWMAEKGAHNLVLLGRTGDLSEDAKGEIDSLLEKGLSVRVEQCDVTDPVALQRVLREIKESLPPLKGVVHAAMVLDDRLIQDMTEKSLEKVMKPKIQGAWNLHQLTQNKDLDLFVLYSSVTTCLGNPGQANYVAANQYLESLALYRRKMGLPAIVVAWDAISDTGYLARNQVLRNALSKRFGMNGLTSERALQLLERLIIGNEVQSIVLNSNWQVLGRKSGLAKSGKFNWLLHNMGEEGISADQDILASLDGLSDEEQRAFITRVVAERAAEILKIPLKKIRFNQPLSDMGIDSLMAMELATAIENYFGVEIPLMSLADNATIESLSGDLITSILGQVQPEGYRKERDVIVSMKTLPENNDSPTEVVPAHIERK